MACYEDFHNVEGVAMQSNYRTYWTGEHVTSCVFYFGMCDLHASYG